MTDKLISVQDALAHILSAFQPVERESVNLAGCRSRVLWEAVTAPADLPAFDNSSMDGFAVRAADVQGAESSRAVRLTVVGDIPAGSVPSFQIAAGQAARIMTGAPLPAGADAVVAVEDSDAPPGVQGPPPAQVTLYAGASAGQYVRPRGQDARAGQVLLERGRVLQPQDAGLMASIGRDVVTVFRRPRVALLSSGDELARPGQPLSPGQIYDSNQEMLAALMEEAGAQVFPLGIAPDDPEAVFALLRRSQALGVDLIVTSAGVSVGAFDFVRYIIETHGHLSLWRVNMRPGKPLAYGSFEGTPVIGLPGNPVSSFVGCRVFVLPVLRRLSGAETGGPASARSRLRAVLAHPLQSDGRESYLRAMVTEENGRLSASLTGHQGSGNLYALVQANALLIVPSGVKSLPAGSEVVVWFFDSS